MTHPRKPKRLRPPGASYEIRIIGDRHRPLRDFYHGLLTLPWPTTVAVIALGFLLAAPALALGEDAAPAAAPAPAAGKHWATCETELTKFCANVEKGKGKKRPATKKQQ